MIYSGDRLAQESRPEQTDFDPLNEIQDPAEGLDFSEAEIGQLQALCEQVPGPIVTDDLSDGQGQLLAQLPDGRQLVNLGICWGQPLAAECLDAHVQLICRAPRMLRRLLDERQRLQQRISELETQVQAASSSLNLPR